MFEILKGIRGDLRKADWAIAAVLARAKVGGSFELGEAWRAFSALGGRQFLVVDPLFRIRQWDYEPDSMRQLLAVASADTDAERAAAFRAAAACAPDGRIREKALSLMVMQPTRAEMAVAMIRTRDWAPEVREAADSALLEMFWSPDPTVVFELFELHLLLQKRKGRAAPAQWQEFFEPLLSGPANRALRLGLAAHPSMTVRRAGFELQFRVDPEYRKDALLSAVKDPSVGNALWALAHARESNDASLWEALLDRASRSPHAGVRAQALRDRHAMHPDQARLRSALLDRARTVRNAAAYLLRVDYHASATPIWRKSAADGSGKESRIATVALLEHAEPIDEAWLKERFDDSSPRVRSMALLALIRLGASDVSTYLERALADSSSLVTREAVKGYANGTDRVDSRRLAAAYENARSAAVRSSLLNAARTLGKWSGLSFLLERSEAADAAEFAQIEPHLYRWQVAANRSFVSLPDETREALLAGLAKAETRHPRFSWSALRSQL